MHLLSRCCQVKLSLSLHCRNLRGEVGRLRNTRWAEDRPKFELRVARVRASFGIRVGVRVRGRGKTGGRVVSTAQTRAGG